MFGVLSDETRVLQLDCKIAYHGSLRGVLFFVTPTRIDMMTRSVAECVSVYGWSCTAVRGDALIAI